MAICDAIIQPINPVTSRNRIGRHKLFDPKLSSRRRVRFGTVWIWFGFDLVMKDGDTRLHLTTLGMVNKQLTMKYIPVDLTYTMFTDFDGSANYELILSDSTLTSATLKIPYRKSGTVEKPVKTEYDLLERLDTYDFVLPQIVRVEQGPSTFLWVRTWDKLDETLTIMREQGFGEPDEFHLPHTMEVRARHYLVDGKVDHGCVQLFNPAAECDNEFCNIRIIHTRVFEMDSFKMGDVFMI